MAVKDYGSGREGGRGRWMEVPEVGVGGGMPKISLYIGGVWYWGPNEDYHGPELYKVHVVETKSEGESKNQGLRSRHREDSLIFQFNQPKFPRA